MKMEVRIETRESGAEHQLFHLCMPNTALQVEMQANDGDI